MGSSEFGPPLLVRRPPREVNMLAIATAALIVLATTASSEPYEHRVHGSVYKYDSSHEAYKMRDYEPSYERHYAEADYREPHHDRYDEDHYGGDAYSEVPTYPSTKSRHTFKKRSFHHGVRDGQIFKGLKLHKNLGASFVPLIINAGVQTRQTTEPPKEEEPPMEDEPPMEEDEDEKDGMRRRRSVRYVQSKPTYKQSHAGQRYKRSSEVSLGCFSSPPEDCGADCVSSFKEDEGCHQCCCHENPVNATTCALPADSGDTAQCRGNFKRWMYNEATGACEPFVYGGCGGNGNRFMCKEMCERHCVHCVRCREGQQKNACPFGTEQNCCCRLIEVISAKRGNKGVKARRSELFQVYRFSPGLVGGRDHWESADRRFAIWSDKGKWIIGPVFERGISGGEPEDELQWPVVRADRDVVCPEKIGFVWEEFRDNAMASLGEGLTVRCKTQ